MPAAKTFFVFLFAVLLFAGTLIQAADSSVPDFKGGKKEVFKELGLTFRAFRCMERMPNPAPVSVTLKSTDGTVIPAVEIRDFWRVRQIGGFLAGNGLTLTVYLPAFPPPTEVKPLWENYHTEDTLHQWMDSLEKTDFAGEEARTQWLTYLAGRPVADAPDFTRFNSSSADKTVSYVLSKPPAKGTLWCVFVLTVPSGAAESGPCRKALKTLADSIRLTVPQKTVKKPESAGKQPKEERSVEYENSRKRVIDSIRSLKDWWYLETDHFIIVSNIRRRKDIRIIQEEAEQIRAFYEKIMPPAKPIRAVSVIRVFDDRDQFNAYTGPGFEWSAGYWSAQKQELVFFIPYDTQKDKKFRTENMRRVLYHELLHQYFFYALNQINAPPWFNEGLAQIYEFSEIKGKKVSFRVDKELDKKVAPALRSDFGNAETIRTMDYDVFQENHKFTYDAVLSMMYFMLKGPHPEYAKIPVRYYQILGKTGDLTQAQTEAWKDIDISQFDQDFHRFWEKKFGRTVNDTAFRSFTGK